MEDNEIQGPKSRAIEICKNLIGSIKKAKKRVPQEFRTNLNTNPSVTANGLQRVLDRIMQDHGLTKNDLK